MSEPIVQDTGLSVIYDPPEASPIADIIFVHGLQGHPRKTWTWKDPHKDGPTPDKASDKKPNPSRKTWLSRVKLRKKSAIVSLEAAETSSAIRHSVDDLFWPVDLLSKSLICSRCRMLTWGYESHVAAKSGTPVNKNTIFGHAKDLFYSLERFMVKGRPIIFVAHSLGGILVKETLHLSESSDEPDLRSIVESTRAVVFLGTPHRGGGGYASLGELVRTIASVFMVDTNPALLDSLGLRSSDLDRCQHNFAIVWRKHAFKVKTFQESLPLTGINIPGTFLNKTVVPAESSSLGDDREHAETLQADHKSMARYGSRTDPNFVKVNGELERICLSIASEPDEANRRAQETALRQMRDVRESLAFLEMDRRVQAIDPPLDDTCLWLKETKQYILWLKREDVDTHRGLVWIKGKPGSGKSTLMKYALNDWQPKESAVSSIRAGFFFNARGSVLDQTPFGLFKSLTYQLLPHFPEQFLPIYGRFLQKQNHANGNTIEWHEEELKSYLVSVLTHRQTFSRKIYLFIDGLDECKGNSAREVVLFFRRLTEAAYCASVELNVCISSQSVLKVSMSPYLEVTVEEHNNEDVIRYVHQKLSVLRMAARQADEEQAVADLESRIIEKSSRIFLWVVLVTDSLLRTWDTGRAFGSLISELDEVPDQLINLFERILERSSANISSRLFQWVAFSGMPLKLSEWAEILPFVYDPSDEAMLSWPSSRYAVQNYEQLETRIQSLSCGLVEVRDLDLVPEAPSLGGDEDSVLAGAGSFAQGKVVQFIHDSVREFFLRGDGFAILKATETNNYGHGHVFILHCCLTYSGLPEMKQLTAARLELAQRRQVIQSLNSSLARHAEEETPKSRFSWWKAKLLRHSSRYYRESSVRRARRARRLQRDETGSVVSFGSSAGNYTPIGIGGGWATWTSPAHSDSPASPAEPDRFNANHFPPTSGGSRLACQPRKNSPRLQKSDLEGLDRIRGLDSPDSGPAGMFTPMESSLAASTRALDKLPILLDYVTNYFDNHAMLAEREGASPESLISRLLVDGCWRRWSSHRADIDLGTPLLYYAAERNLCSWVQCILSNFGSFAPVDQPGGRFRHAAVVAAKQGHSGALSLLLEHDANLERSDSSGRTILHHAALSRQPLLLQTIVDCPQLTRSSLLEAMNRGDHCGTTPLHTAAARSSGQMVSLCLESGAKVTSEDKQRHTPLHLALARSVVDMEVCRALLRAGANPKTRCVHWVSPLQIAEERRDEGLLDFVLFEVPGIDSWWWSWLSWDDWSNWMVWLREYWSKCLVDFLEYLVDGFALCLGYLTYILYWVPSEQHGFCEWLLFNLLGILILGYIALGVTAFWVVGGRSSEGPDLL